MLTGSLGMLPSATLGAVQFDPAGGMRCMSRSMAARRISPARGIANPLGQMLSFAMLLRYSFDMGEDAAC